MYVEGADSEHLRFSLASTRVCRQQVLSWKDTKPTNSEGTKRNETRDAFGATAAFGVVAAIVAVMSCLGQSVLSTQLDDSRWLLEHESLADALKVGQWILEGAVPRWFGSTPAFEQTAIDAEIRTIQRAKRGLAASAAFFDARPNVMGPIEKLRFQLAFVIRAAWPADEIVDVSTHAELMTKLDTQAWYFRHDHVGLPTMTPDQVLPLSQLTIVSRKRRGAADAESSSGQSSSVGSWSSWSVGSVGSVGSNSDCVDVSGLSVA